MENKKNIVKSKFTCINTFDHEVPAVVSAMWDITVGVFEHLDITPKLDIDKRVKYTERILTSPAIKKHCASLMDFKDMVNDFARNQWTFLSARYSSMEYFRFGIIRIGWTRMGT